jgi:DNA ligase (NAD+)
MATPVIETTQEIIQKLKQKDKLSAKDMKWIGGIIEEASETYYNTDNEMMSDEEFDALAREYKRLGGKIEVGANPPKGKGTVEVSHSFQELVGTLDKTNYIWNASKDPNDPTKKSVEEWVQWICKKLLDSHLKDSQFSVGISFKFDGNSVVIEYKNGKVVKALTRGRNGLGMDLTHVFKDHTIPRKDHVGIKYEVIIPWDKYRQLQEDTGTSYANPRNLVSGKLGDKNAYDYYKYMELVPLWVKTKDEIMERMDQLEFIEECFGEENTLFYDFSIVEDVDASNAGHLMHELQKWFDTYVEERYNLPFMIDGLVIEVLEQEFRDVLGYSGDEPNWATALKFPYMQKVTTVNNFDFTLGDSGIITARVWYDEVEFVGTKHVKQSLQNYRRFKELNLGIGSQILVQYRNDCLTYVLPIDNDHNRSITPFPYTDCCPVCGGEVGITETGAFAFCANDECEGKIVGTIQNYLTKMDIKGIKESTILKLRDSGLVRSIQDLYTMDYGKISEIDGLGPIAAINIGGAISGKTPYDYEIIGSMGIGSFSRSKAKELCKTFTVRDLMDQSKSNPVGLVQQIIELEGFNKKTAEYILAGLEQHEDTIEFLLSREHKVFHDEFAKMANVKALKIVFTNFRDQKMQKALEDMGHKITSGVSGKTDVVVTPDPNGNTVKLKSARDKGIRIVGVEEFKKEMGVE